MFQTFLLTPTIPSLPLTNSANASSLTAAPLPALTLTASIPTHSSLAHLEELTCSPSPPHSPCVPKLTPHSLHSVLGEGADKISQSEVQQLEDTVVQSAQQAEADG